MSDVTISTSHPAPTWQGINHLALVTTDMDATVRFYHGVLGGRLVATIGNSAFRHYFFAFGPQCTVAFFEYAGVAIDRFVKSAGTPDSRSPHFDHVALNVADDVALLQLRERLVEANWDVTDVRRRCLPRSRASPRPAARRSAPRY